MKRIDIIALIVLITLVLCSCSANANTQSKNNGKAEADASTSTTASKVIEDKPDENGYKVDFETIDDDGNASDSDEADTTAAQNEKANEGFDLPEVPID